MKENTVAIKISEGLNTDLAIEILSWQYVIAMKLSQLMASDKDGQSFQSLLEECQSQKRAYRKVLLDKIYEDNGDISDMMKDVFSK